MMKNATCGRRVLFALFWVVAIWLPASPARAASELACEGLARQAVIACCEKAVRQRGLPEWMALNGLSCRSAVACAPRRNGSTYCRVYYRQPPLELPEDLHQ